MGNEPRRMGGKGSDVLLGGELSDPNKIRTESQPPIDPIATLRPWEPADKLAARRRLNSAALRSAARATVAQSPHARQLFWLMNCIAATWTFGPVETERLTDILDALNRAALAADTFERFRSGL